MNHHIREMGLEGEERRRALETQLPPRGSQVPHAPSQPREPQPLLEVEATPPAEQVAIAAAIE